ncbi:hypothetical protein HNV11_05835 [Spirosoma taeanense]|uniref:DUF2157 domain-containing protein n=1 Tax=Spirosoma taeanense TaxID=2735870 RepID=A0A6M5Y2T8_9BACT|nr:hypothetical protein [Spirosoma taeanense]QJW88937.1 hypothetical protein HNV11_05835 [Spirosoma taeanense]
MKLYNESWVKNRDIVQQANQWHRQSLLTDEQLDRIRQAYPINFWRPNPFVEIGLFLFTMVAMVGGYALLALLLGELFDTVFGLFNLLMAIGTGTLAYVMINRRQYYHNGVDNALIIGTAALAVAAVTSLLPSSPPFWTICAIALPVLLALVWYAGDTLVMFVALVMFYGLIFDGLLEFSWGRPALPFVLIVVSEVAFQAAKRAERRPYYADAFNLTEWVALIVLVASGNYFVVREINGLLLPSAPGQPVFADAPEIGLAALFWVLTLAIPVAYLWQGLARKNRMLLILGGVGLIAAVATVQEYTEWVPLNVALTLGGLILIGMAVGVIRFLQQPRNGFTDVPDEESPNEFFTNVETIGAMQAATGTQHGPNDKLRYGGGDFGGGGSEGKY